METSSKVQKNKKKNPNFRSEVGALAPDMHLDWLKILTSENAKRITNAKAHDFAFFEPKVVEYIFTICERLRLPNEIKHLSLFIFNDYMRESSKELHKFFQELSYSEDEKIEQWERVEATQSRQLTLRIVSSIQIGSKLFSLNEFHIIKLKSLDLNVIKLCLKTLGFVYTDSALHQSELRVLDVLKWNLRYESSPVVYVETLLKFLEIKWQREFDVESYWTYALFVMDCVFTHWFNIYNRMLFNIIGPAVRNIPRERLSRVQSDWLLLAAGVVTVAATCCDDMATADEVIMELNAICGTPKADIIDMCVAIIEFMLKVANDAQVEQSEKGSTTNLLR